MRKAVTWSDLPSAPLIEPSLYAADLMRLGEQIDALIEAGVRAFHVDIGDGNFVGPVILGDIVVKAIAQRVHPHGALVDCHMMVAEPERQIERIAEAGGDSFTFHVETTKDPERIIGLVREAGLQVGIAASPDTSIMKLCDHADEADLALCMAVRPGLSGQPFLNGTLKRITQLRTRLPAQVRIQVDGGVGADNINTVVQHGADLLVAGTSIFGGSDEVGCYLNMCGLLGY